MEQGISSAIAALDQLEAQWPQWNFTSAPGDRWGCLLATVATALPQRRRSQVIGSVFSQYRFEASLKS
jgi:hypothetical protein